MFFARWNLYFQGVVRLALGDRTLAASLEAAALLFFFTWMGVLVAAVGRGEETLFAAFAARVVYLLICNGVAGILHVQISVSHFSQPTIKTRATDEGVSFLEAQLAGTLNITLPSGADFLFGGLQFQIEHHLFPRLPAEALRALQPRVRALAKAHGLAYNEATFSGANTKLYESLKATAKAALAHGGNIEFNPIVLDALNMQG
jgi:fatty acid desaturase